jgi:tetratricopeptide (TPR) repeat protein
MSEPMQSNGPDQTSSRKPNESTKSTPEPSQTLGVSPSAADTAPIAGSATQDFTPSGSRATVDPAPAGSGATADFTPLAASFAKSRSGAVPAIDPATGRAFPALPGYQILSELGRGGMGVVYKARQTALNRLVAIKMVLAGGHAGPEQLARFHTEAQAVAALQHANIVQIYEVGECDGLPYFTLEFVDGGPLDKALAGKPQVAKDAAKLLETLSRAMHFAHEQGIVHRDLKPANVLLSADGVPKITDFGLAKKLESDSSQTKSGTLMGTPSYMAPEQARGEFKELGPPADVHALGAMLYEMLTGRPPFLGATPVDTIMQVIKDEPVPPSQLIPKLHRDIETICLKCLQKESLKRYADCEALAEDLRRFVVGEPILARPVSAPERLWRWCRRNPRIAGLSAVVLCLLVAVAIGSTASAITIAQERNQKEQQRQAAEEAKKSAEYNQQLAEKRKEEADAQRIEARNAEKLAVQRKEEAENAKTRADANAKVADEQRKLSLDTLHTVVTKVEEQLHDKPDMRTLRKEVLETAMAGLDKVAKSAQGSVLADRSMGIAVQRMGDMYLQLGESDKAMELYKRSLEIYDKLPTDTAEGDWVLWNSAISSEKLADVMRQKAGDIEGATKYYQKALELREALAANPRLPVITPAFRKQALVNSYAKAGGLALAMGKPAEARDYYRKGLEQSEGLMAIDPKNLRTKEALAVSNVTLGNVSFRLREVEASREFYKKALTLRKELVEENALSVKAKFDLAGSYDALGDLELQLRIPSEALAYYRESSKIREEVYERDKESFDAQWARSISYYRLGIASLLDGNAEAEKYFQDCLAVREPLVKADAQNVSKQIGLMLARARCGQHPSASATAETLWKTGTASPNILYSAACCYAICISGVAHGKTADELTSEDQALQQRYAEAVVGILTEAVKKGYNDLVGLEVDPDLDPVQKFPAYQELLKSLREKSQLATPSKG